jgi:hypothetical protein
MWEKEDSRWMLWLGSHGVRKRREAVREDVWGEEGEVDRTGAGGATGKRLGGTDGG